MKVYCISEKNKVFFYTTQLPHDIRTFYPIYSWYLKSPVRTSGFKATRSLYTGCSKQLLDQLLVLGIRGLYNPWKLTVCSLQLSKPHNHSDMPKSRTKEASWEDLLYPLVIEVNMSQINKLIVYRLWFDMSNRKHINSCSFF